MSKKTNNSIPIIIGILFVIGVITFAVISGNGNDQSKYSASVLSAIDNNFDWGTISMKNGDVSHKFELQNDGTETVKIEKIYTSCMCTTASITDASGKKRGPFGMPGHGLPSRTNVKVEPGQSVIVNAIFDPAAHGPMGVGLAQRSIYLETNSSKSPKIELSLQAMVVK